MPVPRRRKSKGLSVPRLAELAPKLLDINFVFQHTKVFLLYGFMPAVLFIGLRTEPRPSLIDVFNIWE